MKILIINGPNLNMLGIREPAIYGSMNYEGLCRSIRQWCEAEHVEGEIFQSNHEGAIVDRIQAAYVEGIDGIVKATGIPTVEVHISDVMAREAFRHHSYVSLAALKTIMGHGVDGYREGIAWLVEYLRSKSSS